MMKRWQNSKEGYDNVQTKVADQIIAEANLNVYQLNKARYSFLSSKVACQRANSKYRKSLLLAAEQKRKELRERQK